MFNDDIKRFAAYITQDWLRKATNAANETHHKLILAAFTAAYKYEGVEVQSMIKNGLIDLIQYIVNDLTVEVRHYLYNREDESMLETYNPQFANLMDENIIHIIVIQLKWD